MDRTPIASLHVEIPSQPDQYSDSKCSGVHLSEDIFLTAAHCFRDRQFKTRDSSQDLHFYTVFESPKIVSRYPPRTVKQIFVHPTCIKNNEDCVDMALVLLEHSDEVQLEAPDFPKFQELQDYVNSGSAFYTYGLGLQRTQNSDIADDGNGWQRGILFSDPTDLSHQSLILFNESSPSQVLWGDSGGPDLMEINGKIYLAAINQSIRLDTLMDKFIFNGYYRMGKVQKLGSRAQLVFPYICDIIDALPTSTKGVSRIKEKCSDPQYLGPGIGTRH